MMAGSRRAFVGRGALAVLGAVAAGKKADAQTPSSPVAGAPPAFGTAPAVGPDVTASTFAEAEKLVQVTMFPAERAQAAGNWRQSMAALFERRRGPRKVLLGDADVPATVWRPVDNRIMSYVQSGRASGEFFDHVAALPKSDVDIAFASVWTQSQWISRRLITSTQLTRIYLDRLKRYQPKLNCVITLCEAHAMEQAGIADEEIAAGKYRSPLHGIPWGAKDLLDTKGILTTWGAEFYRDRVPEKDAAVVAKLKEAGAVLVAKLSLGALALNDVWFGGQTMNPWLLEEGASGSSAGPGAAVAAGLVSFAIGSETQGSIISPSMRCGVTGLRPTFGRVPRTGAMTLSWSCDKLGPMARAVQDTQMVLDVISGYDEGDVATFDGQRNQVPLKEAGHLRVGYVAKWMAEAPATDVDRAALQVVKKLGMTVVPVELPDWPYDSLNVILFAESAAAFEHITLDHRVDQLKMQVPDAWPNTFRQSRFLSAVDFVQADRLRRKVATEVARVFETVDVLLVPSLRDEALVIFNFTGHPSLTLRAGFVEVSEVRSDWAPDSKHPLPRLTEPRRVPHGVTLVGKLFAEESLIAAGRDLERAFGVGAERPAGFA